MKLFATKQPAQDYTALPGTARVWIYQSSRAFTEEETTAIQALGVQFADQWNAHGRDLTAAVEVFHHRFLVIFLDEEKGAASGCSIDSSVGLIRNLQQTYNVDLLDRMQVAYEADGEIRTVHMHEFGDWLKEGKATAETLVFNNLVTNKAELERNWRVPVAQSWHKQLLP